MPQNFLRKQTTNQALINRQNNTRKSQSLFVRVSSLVNTKYWLSRSTCQTSTAGNTLSHFSLFYFIFYFYELPMYFFKKFKLVEFMLFNIIFKIFYNKIECPSLTQIYILISQFIFCF